MSARSLAEQFAERIAELMTHVPVLPGSGAPEGQDIEADPIAMDYAQAGIWQDSLAEQDPEVLAKIVVAELERYAEAFIPNATVRRSMLADDETVSLWPLTTRDWGKPEQEDATSWTLYALEVGTSGPTWHPDVNASQVADMLERRKGDVRAAFLAMMVRGGNYGQQRGDGNRNWLTIIWRELPKFPPTTFGLPHKSWDDVQLTDIGVHDSKLEPEAMGLWSMADQAWNEASDDEAVPKEERQRLRSAWHSRYNAIKASICYMRLADRWSPYPVSILFYLEHKVLTDTDRLLQAQAKHIRTPTAIVQTWLAGRSSDYKLGTTVRTDPTGRTFQVPDRLVRPWRLTGPRGIQLSLALDHELASNNPFAAVRDALGPTFVRFYLADWYLVAEQCNETGIHKVEPRHVLHDVLGLRPAYTTSKGKRYPRPHPKNEAMLDDAYWRFEHTLLVAIGNTRLNPPDPLVRAIELTQETTGRKGTAYVPAPFAMHEFTRNFMQIPLAALSRLGANRVELALGLASIMRQHVREWVPKGTLAMPLADWARQAGEPVKDRLAREGRSYWVRLRDQLAEVASRGEFGRMHFGRGDGGAVIGTLEPGEDIGRVYEGLVRRIGQRKELAEKAQLEAEVRKLEGTKPKPGRPRGRKARR